MVLTIGGPATLDLLFHETGLHRHVRPDGSEELARVVVEAHGAAQAAPNADPGAVVRVYEEGKRRVVRDPRTGARESHVVRVLEEGRIDAFLIAALSRPASSARATPEVRVRSVEPVLPGRGGVVDVERRARALRPCGAGSTECASTSPAGDLNHLEVVVAEPEPESSSRM